MADKTEEPAEKAEKKAGDGAPFGFDVVGEDDRRITRGLPETAAKAEAHRISSASGETIRVVAAEGAAPSVPGPAPDENFPPVAGTLKPPDRGE